MATAPSQPIVFIVPGREEPAVSTRGAAAAPLPAGLKHGRLKQSVQVTAQRGIGAEVRVAAIPGEDVVVLHIAGGPALTLHPENARDLMLAQQGEIKRGRSRGTDIDGPNEVRVLPQLRWRGLAKNADTRGATRGFLGDVLLSAIEVVTGVAKDPAADFVASKVVERFDAQVPAGLYLLDVDSFQATQSNAAPLAQAPAAPDGEPLLVLIHGTFSSTSGTFSKLWAQHPAQVRLLLSKYGNRVYGLDHPTLGLSPIDNALALARACPNRARLHLLTHSRGGLVAEVLARICANPQLDAETLGFFAGDAYKPQREALKSLAAEVKTRNIKVERIVRVACPARGTLLASKRLDAYLSVFKWTLELAGLAIAPALVEFLGEVAQRRADPLKIPGLAAQIPDGPLVRWLHAVEEPIAGDLRVVAGDLEGDSVTSWLKTLLADAFYWTDNDLVVQTRSMYGGAPRARGASFVLDQGGKVSHFNYFSNERTAAAVVDALTQNAPPGFRVIGPLSWSGESSGGERGRARGTSAPTSELPAVFLLPGILGSNLKVDGKRIWLGWRLINGLKRLEYQPGRPDSVEPDGPIGQVYDDLADYLAKTHQVIEFAFDWRKPIEEEAQRLAVAVDAALDARATSGQPVRLLAHSMGGLLARTMQLERPKVWQRLMVHPQSRLLMLGTPNAGSWAPMQVLSGDDTFGNTLAAFGAPFQDHAARAMMARFPGFIQLQAELLNSKLALDKHQTWQSLADEDLKRVQEHNWWHSDERQLSAYTWGVPPQEVLDQAVALRRRLDAQVAADLAAFSDKIQLVVGSARFTPDGFEVGDAGLVYLDAPEAGDGRVTRASASLNGVRTWQIECEHGSLPDHEASFDAYRELLETGTTDRLKLITGTSGPRGGVASSAYRRSRPSRTGLAAPPPEDRRTPLVQSGRKPRSGDAHRGDALPVTVINGDVTFIRQPLLIGHYRSLRLSGTEAVVDGLIGGAMGESLKTGLYPVPAGTHQIFLNRHADPHNPLQMPRPQAVIVVGLGEEGRLTPTGLVYSVRQATMAWAQRIAEGLEEEVPALFELAATLIGSGGTGIALGQSAQLVARGVREADAKLRDANHRQPDRRWPRVGHLYLIELYLDRAVEAWRALQIQNTAAPGQYNITDVVRSGTGAFRRSLDSSYRGANYDLLTALTEQGWNRDSVISYTLDTKRARTEVRAQATQGPLLRELVVSASNNQNSDQRIGRTLFKLLVPVEMEPFLGGGTEMVIELDGGTAGIPWELLDSDTDSGSGQPWAIRSKLLRKLRTAEFRDQVADANADACVLVIGEPKCDIEIYPRLSGARDEANAVVAQLTSPGNLDSEWVKSLISPDDLQSFGPDALSVINTLMERDWRIVHIAGHGAPAEMLGPAPKRRGDPPQQVGDPRGVVLSGESFLGPREIHSMRVAPELVFVNCCHLAARNVQTVLKRDESQRGGTYDRAQFAATVAEELIKIGVRCVIAAGWAVDDDAAKTFATTLYAALLRGERFIDAVGGARIEAWKKGGNTWAAYQCYGDPDWVFRRAVGDAQQPTPPLADEFAGIASAPALTLALETLAIKSKYQNASPESQLEKIRHLEKTFVHEWGSMGAVAEAFGVAYAEAKDAPAAIDWYSKALAANDGSASIKATEQLGNLRARSAWEAVQQAYKKTGQRGVVQLDKARAEIGAALKLLEGLTHLQPSIERESLCGSAWKRLALLERIAERPNDELAAIAQMKAFYGQAETRARENRDPGLFYPALNRMAAELVVDAAKPGWSGFDSAIVAEVRECLTTKAHDDPDFWSIAGLTELRLYLAMAGAALAREASGIEREFTDLRNRVSARWMWSSVNDQASLVLPTHSARVGGADRKAAEHLQALLRTFAQEE